MYNPSDFVISLNTGPLINLTTGGTTSLVFNVANNDPVNTLYNLSFQLTLGDGMEFISSSTPYTSVSGSVYSFTNIKDLAPNETGYKFTIDIKLATIFTNGNAIPFGTLIPCTLMASADTMPRGIYDNSNQIIESTSSFSFSASEYIIYKINPSALLLGEVYTSKIIIETAENSGVFFDNFQDFLGNGVNYLGNVSITGYSSSQLTNFVVVAPNNSTNSYTLSWSNVSIPQNTTVTIQFSVKFNERYYLNGSGTGAYIQNATSIFNDLSWSVSSIVTSYSYQFMAYEVILDLVMSKSIVDINESLIYSIYFYGNLYHNLLNLSGYLTTSDGQVLANTSIPMFTSINTSSGGITQVAWNVGTISAGTTAIITIDGNIASQYLKNGLNILAGDTFTIYTTCNAISAATNIVITSSDSGDLQINIPSVSKTITGYFYSDNTPKPFNTIAPGDYISYKSVYDSSTLSAPSSGIKIFDFYPYMTNNILGINYDYSSPRYPGTSVVPVEPYGVLWYAGEIPGNQSFEIDYTTQIINTSTQPDFPYNLFKLQVVNSNRISYSSRSQVAFTLGQPNLTLNKSASGNNINKVKIGEVYSFVATLINDNSLGNATDAFNITFTETIASYVTLDYNSITPKINNTPISWDLQNNEIIINIPNLAPGDVFTLNYDVSINNTLGPSQSFTFTSSTTVPYTQAFNLNNTNIQYDAGALTANSVLNSEAITLHVTSDAPTKIVGDTVYYTLSVTFPMGQILSSFYGLILIPSSETYSNQAWLNNNPITATQVNSTIIFPPISNIDTTLGAISYIYKIKCLVSDSIVSTMNPLYTIESFYGNLSYVSMLNVTSNLGVNNFITVNHPHVDMSMGSSNVMNGFTSPYIVGTSNIIYTQVVASNSGSTAAINIQMSLTMPTGLNFDLVETASSGVTYSYNTSTSVLAMTINSIAALSNKYLIFKAHILTGNAAESKLIISDGVNSYYNNVSTTKVYTSDQIYNDELYLNSLISFLPLSFYSLTGSTAALNLSALGVPTQIEYILTNIGQGYDSYKLTMTPINYSYDVYIGSTFVQTIIPNNAAAITSTLLNNINPGNSTYISFKYTIPVDSPNPYQTMLVTATSLVNSNTKKTIPTTLQDP